MRNIVVVLSILISRQLSAQSTIEPRPQDGWDSLKARIKVPEIFVRAGVRLAVSVSIEVDSTGELSEVLFAPFNTEVSSEPGCVLTSLDSAFCIAIEEACKNTQLEAGSVAGSRRRMTIEVPFIFTTYSVGSYPSEQYPIIVRMPRPNVKTYNAH